MNPFTFTIDPLNPWLAIAALLLAFATISLFLNKIGVPDQAGRYDSIDGLRGYLAFFVYLHHAATWYFYLKHDRWMLPPSNLYTHLGQSSVALFFMITGFLFFSKILDGRERKIDWLKVYVSRVLRLVPLYLVLILMLLGCVAIVSGGVALEPFPDLAKNISAWIFFTMPGMVDINQVKGTFIMVSGVTWSLVYEWFFYLLLPTIALFFGVTPPVCYLVASWIGMAAIVWIADAIPFSFTFAGGLAAAILARNEAFRSFSRSTFAALIAAGCLATVVFVFPTTHGKPQIALLSVAFSIIAAGNSLFGLMTHQLPRALGEVAYSIYLLHGMVLFGIFTFIVGIPAGRGLSPAAHWLIVLGITPFLVAFCIASFKWIELPAMRQTARVTAWFRS